MIYFIECCGPEHFLKIGVTGQEWDTRPSAILAEERRLQLQMGCPYPLRILATMRGDQSAEKNLHERFAPFRVRGEWFKLEEPLLRFILSYATLTSDAERQKAMELSRGNPLRPAPGRRATQAAGVLHG